ncbi:hypothetical protein SUNI508_01676 [Seiridium unicorne]|uniref:Uncharacterized protein n=1 Tax=Seiridium unicorne TaxID=138068 RepID=A0ABR2UP08_9PEZI
MAPSAADELALQREEMNSSKVYTCSAGQVLLWRIGFPDLWREYVRPSPDSGWLGILLNCTELHPASRQRRLASWRHKPPELTSTIDFLNWPSHEHRFLLIFDSDPGIIPGTPRESMETTARHVLMLRKTSYLLALRTSRARFVPVTCNAAHGTRVGIDTLIREPGPSTY